jgi:hypothetical protein
MVGWKLKILFLDPNSDKFQVLRSKKRTNVNPSLYNTTCLINLSAVDDLFAALKRGTHVLDIDYAIKSNSIFVPQLWL